MVNDESQFDRYLEQYDELAVSLLDDPRPNSRYGIPWSNQELTQIVLSDMDWESFDLFMPIPYAEAYEGEDVDVARSYCFIAFLRMLLFASAFANHIGEPEFNKTASAHSELWFKRLKDRYESLSKKNDTKHGWIH
jgi:hypothetical protein